MRDEAKIKIKIKIKDLEDGYDFCGVQFKHIQGGYRIHQLKYIEEELAKHAGYSSEEKQHIPMSVYNRFKFERYLDQKEIKLYQEILGALNWLTRIARPDIAYCVNKFASYTKDTRDVDLDLEQLKRIFLYLRDTKDFAIEILETHFPDRKVKLYAFTDASFGNECERKSRTTYIIYLNGSPICWKSKKQAFVTTSTYASEYVALSSTVHELLWLKSFFRELGIETVEMPKILEDNRGVVFSVNGTGNNPSNNKHVDIKEKHIQDRVQRGEISVESVGTEGNLADAFTKGLTRIPFGRHFPYLDFHGKFMIRTIRAIGPRASL